LSTSVNARVRWRRLLLLALALVWLAVAWHQSSKPLPEGMHLASFDCTTPPQDVAFIADITAADAWGRNVVSQGIFDEVLKVVRDARRFIVLDYSEFAAGTVEVAPERHLAAELTDALLARRREQSGPIILFITDPANERYGARPSAELQLLRAAGVEVVTVDLDRLRDSNPLYSSLWRLGFRWWDTPSGPLGFETRRLNFKADKRRLVIADDGAGAVTAVIGSANPSDRQSAWSNVAVRSRGGAVQSLLQSELDIARFSGWRGSQALAVLPAAPPGLPASCNAPQLAAPSGAATHAGQDPASPQANAGAATADRLQLGVLTEGALRDALLEHIAAATSAEAIDAALYQLADRGVVEELLAAARRGVRVRLILDPNETAASGGTEGIPNQPVASELVSRSGGAIHVRWYRTHGEHFHAALLMIYGAREVWLTTGSAQFTRRGLDDYNLEASVAIDTTPSAPFAQQARQYFDTLWSNRAALGIEYTADFAVFANPAQSDYWLYRLMEGTGFAPF
jgi:phosphatidylserine/phosphatidylglycerophosphate/cardiolipin synthase-like enzyme